jgi:UDP-2-acetamido-2-deoxy-ribo-hexuluronate aminotransferase
VLLAKFGWFAQEVEARAEAGARYNRLLDGAVVTPYIEPQNTSVYAQYTVQVDDREMVQSELKKNGIPTAVHYPVPLHLQPAFAALGYKKGDFPVSEAAAQRVISLPMHPYIAPKEQQSVADALIAATTRQAAWASAR